MISITSRRSGPYVTNGNTVDFPYGFHISDESELVVYKRTVSTNTEEVLILNTDYTVTDVGEDAGGEVVISPALASGFEITVIGSRPFTQPTDYPNQGTYHASVIEQSLDTLTKLCIQLLEQTDRCLKIAQTDPVSTDTLFDPVDGEEKFVKRQADGDFVLAAYTSGVLTGVNGYGDTASRPAGLGVADAMKYTYLDEDLGYPIYWAGTSWKTYSGMEV